MLSNNFIVIHKEGRHLQDGVLFLMRILVRKNELKIKLLKIKSTFNFNIKTNDK